MSGQGNARLATSGPRNKTRQAAAPGARASITSQPKPAGFHTSQGTFSTWNVPDQGLFLRGKDVFRETEGGKGSSCRVLPRVRQHRRCRPRHGRQFGHGAHPQFGRAGPGGILGEVCGVRRGRGRLWRLASKEPSGALRLGRGGKRAWRRPLRTGTAAGHSLPRGRRLTTRRTRRRRHCRPSRRRCCSCPRQCPWSGSASWTTW